jgi:hypothetical protein
MERHVHWVTARAIARSEVNVNIANPFGLTFAGLTLIIACNRSNDPEPMAPASAQVAETEESGVSAADSIARSRCEREERCDNIGGDKKFSSMDDCLTRVRTDWKDDLDARECPGGINRAELDECLNEIRSEDCSSPFDTLERVAACTSGQICES